LVLPVFFGGMPIHLLRGVTQEVQLELNAFQDKIAEIELSIADKQVRSEELGSEVANERQTSDDRSVEVSVAEAELKRLQDAKCFLEGLQTRHRDALKEAKAAIVNEAKPQEAELNTAINNKKKALKEEHSHLEDDIPHLRMDIEELRRDLKQRSDEVEVGMALVDNDAVYLQAYLGRLSSNVDSYSGSYMLNVAELPPIGKPLMLPKIKHKEEELYTVSQDLVDVLPKMDPFIKPNRVVYRSCAVVGSSGILLYYRRGEEIDKHEAVIRFNAAPTAGFEDYVGSKTTVRFVNRLHFGYYEKVSDTVLQQVTTPETMEKFIAMKKEMPAARLFMVSPDFHRHVVSELNKPPTNGMYGILFALQRCSSISLYGFFRGNDAHVPYHYFDTDAPITAQRARDLQEWPLLLELVRRSNGRMKIMDPCQMPEEQCAGDICTTCAAGSMCQCGHGLPVARPGFCMESGVADCFYQCTNFDDCPGFANSTECGDRSREQSCATLSPRSAVM